MDSLRTYAELLLEWNRTTNLTGARSLDQVEALIADTNVLLAIPWEGIHRVVDIGSGAGLPAIPLALKLSQIQFSLLEANTRKCAFLQHVAGTLQMRNVTVLAGRAEELGHRPELREQFDRATSRAAAPPAVLLELALPFVKPGGDLVGEVSTADPHLLEPAARILGGDAPRLERPVADGTALLVVRKIGPTPATYPRRIGIPSRKPLA
ncbi:MAG TPA: 16S rRNA (guanine(527)-N(7))-methyltransferase RsmG [Candidatus Acidoferrum sp.]|nr:16S rRNA (guanine(527)-N(7))-methyltransferase RsmG [Candidatus Acidoferrum sp.]